MVLKKKKKFLKQPFFFSRLFLTLVGLVIIMAVSFPLAKNIRQQRALDKEIKSLKQEIAKMEKRNEGLDKLIAYLQSDQFTEEEARLQLGLKKEGEEAIVIKGIGSSSKSIDNIYDLPPLTKTAPKISNLQKWWQYFFQPKI